MTNGARNLLDTFVAGGIEVCFSNPGTSEMHFVAALDEVPALRGVLTLFEGVATGAADGYGRLAGKPAATLLHLGPGLGNGLANLHNARRARSPIVNVVGDHATYHQRFDAPLQSDIASVAGTVSNWVNSATRPEEVADLAAQAIAAAVGPPAGVATLLLPADASWNETAPAIGKVGAKAGFQPVSAERFSAVVDALRAGARVGFLLGSNALVPAGQLAAARIRAATGSLVLTETFPRVSARGAGLPQFDRLGYLGEFARAQLADVDTLVLVDAADPVSFFAYPGQPSRLCPESTEVLELCGPAGDAVAALEALAEAIGAPATAPVSEASRPELPTGALTASTMATSVARHLPEGAVLVDESNTSGIFVAGATEGAARHDLCTLTGGAIGYGLPTALGAALARPGAPVLCLESDGSASYTLQALWTMARESLDVTVVLLQNHAYAILEMELARVGAHAPGGQARRMLELNDPQLDFAALAAGFGVPATVATDAADFDRALAEGLGTPGPKVVVAPLPRL